MDSMAYMGFGETPLGFEINPRFSQVKLYRYRYCMNERYDDHSYEELNWHICIFIYRHCANLSIRPEACMVFYFIISTNNYQHFTESMVAHSE